MKIGNPEQSPYVFQGSRPETGHDNASGEPQRVTFIGKGMIMAKVLIAEDDPTSKTYIQASLESYRDRFEITLVNDGLEAINALRRDCFDVLVTDLKMPRIEGLVLLAYMNKNFPRIPCIVMTSLKRPHVKAMTEKDVLRYIEKPFRMEELAETILTALDPDTADGSVAGISVANFLSLIHMENKSCVCEIWVREKDSGEAEGLLFFRDGILFRAVFKGAEGKTAALEIIQSSRATINFKPLPETVPEKNVDAALPDIIHEALRLKHGPDTCG